MRLCNEHSNGGVVGLWNCGVDLWVLGLTQSREICVRDCSDQERRIGLVEFNIYTVVVLTCAITIKE